MLTQVAVDRFYLIAVVLVLCGSVPGSAAAISTGEDLTPGLGEVIPLEKRGGQVVFRHATLLNPAAVVPAGAVARTVFFIPRPTDADVRLFRHREDKKAAYSAQKLPDTRALDQSPEVKAAEERAQRTVWDDDMRFRAALQRMRLAELRFIYEDPAGNIKAEAFSFPENLFLGEIEGIVTVLAVGTGSRAERLGFATGTKILAINGKPLDRGLLSFQQHYLPEKNAAAAANRPLVFTVEIPGQTERKDLAFPQIGAMQAHDFFNAADVLPTVTPPTPKVEPEVFDPFAPRR